MIKHTRIILMAFFVALFLPGLVLAQKEQDFSFDFNRKFDPELCAFPGFSLSMDTKIYATGDNGGSEIKGQKLGWQIDDSGYNAILINVTVNSPDPVILVLAAYKPNVWHLNWTKGTQIAAVLLVGYHAQKVAGLPEGTPILSTEHQSPCRYFDSHALNNANHILKDHVGREVDKFFPASGGHVLIGEPLPDGAELITNLESRVEDFHDPNKPLAGQAGLDEAEKKGLIKKATRNDVQEYLALEAKNVDMSDQIIKSGFYLEAGMLRDPYVVLSPDFVIPAGLYGADSVTFILPEGIPQPKGPIGHCTVKSYAAAKPEERYVRPHSYLCRFPDLQIPQNLKVYTTGADYGTRFGANLGNSDEESYLMELAINSPEEPVALILLTNKSTFWHFSWTKGTKISAVYISGQDTQIVTGLAKDVPILNALTDSSGECPTNYSTSFNYYVLLAVNELSKHLFKKGLDQVYRSKNGKVLIGEPLVDDVKLETMEELEKFMTSKGINGRKTTAQPSFEGPQER